MIFLGSSLLLYGALFSEGHVAGYTYVDCSVDIALSGGPGCFTLHFDSGLSGFFIEDNGERAQPLEPAIKKAFFIFITSQIPIAVPRTDYEKTNTWRYKDIFVFSKVVHHFTAQILSIPIAADIIEVKDSHKKHVLNFWYSPEEGVQAIIFEAVHPYYCSKPPCLFASSAN